MLLETVRTLQHTSEPKLTALLADKDKCSWEKKDSSYHNIVIAVCKEYHIFFLNENDIDLSLYVHLYINS